MGRDYEHCLELGKKLSDVQGVSVTECHRVSQCLTAACHRVSQCLTAACHRVSQCLTAAWHGNMGYK